MVGNLEKKYDELGILVTELSVTSIESSSLVVQLSTIINIVFYCSI